MEDKPDLIEVPIEQLVPETVTALIEAFILREGTNYGAEEVPLETQIRQVQAQLKKRTIKLVFDPESESCSLVTERQFRDRKLKSH